MSDSANSRDRRRARRAAWIVSALVTGAAVALLSALAAAKTSKPTLRTTRNAALGERIVVDSSGRTVYELAPETARHLLCSSKLCLSFWPPLKVSKHAKLVKGQGVKGKLGRLHRSGFDQLTLDGRPLYRYSGDSARGQANGQGIRTFGGTWHVVKASGGTTKSTGPGTTTTSTTTSTSSTYTYPY